MQLSLDFDKKIATKMCTKCKEEKEHNCFSRNRSKKCGLHSSCRACEKEYRKANKDSIAAKNKEYRKANKDYLAGKNKEHYKTNKDSIAAKRKKHYKANKDSLTAKNKEYQKANRYILNARDARRRARKLNATPDWLTDEHKEQMKAIYREAKKMEKKTGITHHVDHIEPLQGENVSGLHVPWNLQVLTATDNLSKGNRQEENYVS